MPPIRDHEMVYDEAEEDDGMPPLVDNPNPSMTFTFLANMRPITFSSTEPTTFEVLPESSTLSSPPASPSYPEDNPAPSPSSSRASHSKKRDASYIPRPPNAFILFRSSFIKSKRVPGKVEGNHSTLSKIIGRYWKTLSREEREQWEAKAVIAQAEHRERYPDWRFRPGANAMAKLKVKDGPGTSKKRYHQTRKSKEEADGSENSVEQRCAKIADLLVEGKKGPDLEAAVKEWEGGRTKAKGKTVVGKGSAEGRGRLSKELAREERARGGESEISEGDSKLVENRGPVTRDDGPTTNKLDPADSTPTEDGFKTRSKTPDSAHDGRFKVPLTSMFRRSLSAPASRTRCPCPDIVPSPSAIATHSRRETVSFPLTTAIIHQPLSGPLGYQRQHEASVRRDDINDTLDCVLSSRSPHLTFADGASTRWNDVLPHSCPVVPVPFSLSTTAGFSYDSANPTPSSSNFKEIYTVQVPSGSSSISRGGGRQVGQAADLGMTYAVYRYNPQVSSYSTLEGWDGDNAPMRYPIESRRSSFASPPLTLQGQGNFADNWSNSPGASQSTTSPSASSEASSAYRIDPQFGWYERTDGDNRAMSSMRGLHEYSSVGLNNTFAVGEPSNTSTTETETSSDSYLYSFSNPPL